MVGTVIKVYKDNEGEWLQIKYGKFPHRINDFHRYDKEYCRPIQANQKNKNRNTNNKVSYAPTRCTVHSDNVDIQTLYKIYRKRRKRKRCKERE